MLHTLESANRPSSPFWVLRVHKVFGVPKAWLPKVLRVDEVLNSWCARSTLSTSCTLGTLGTSCTLGTLRTLCTSRTLGTSCTLSTSSTSGLMRDVTRTLRNWRVLALAVVLLQPIRSVAAAQSQAAGRMLLATVVDTSGKAQVDFGVDDFLIEE